MNDVTMTLQADHLILEALKEDISSEDVTTNAVMKEAVKGEVELICKEDGIIAGLHVFKRVFELLDSQVMAEFCDPKKFKVILASGREKYRILRLEELLPFGFGSEYL